MIKQGLELKQTQKLSPLQIQTIKLIELPIQDLEQKIRAEIEENPVLEDVRDSDGENTDGDVSLDEIKDDDYIPAYKTRVNNWGKDPRPEYNTFSVKTSFNQSLMDQLGCRNLTSREHDIAAFLIGSLDSDGYLRRDIESIVDDLAFRAGINTDSDEVLRMLSVIQDFEPAGVGARDLRECLLLQLRGMRQNDDVKNAERILKDCFQDFTNKHFQRIMSRLSLGEDQLKGAMARILKLNPSPGGDVSGGYEDHVQQIVPDFVLEEHDGELSFSMPRFSVPELRVNRKYADMLMSARGSSDRERKEAVTFVKQKLDSAKWFVEALKQRQKACEDSLALVDSIRRMETAVRSLSEVGDLYTTSLDHRYYIIVGAFLKEANADAMLKTASDAGYVPVKIALNGFVAVGVSPADRLGDAFLSLKSVKREDFCPPDVWILVNR